MCKSSTLCLPEYRSCSGIKDQLQCSADCCKVPKPNDQRPKNNS